MMKRVFPFLLAIVIVILVAAAGCGTSGSSPILYHEVRFQVEPANSGIGQATFSVISLNADGVPFGFANGTTFTTTGAFNFYLDGAAPPYSATFVQQGDAPILVSVFIDRNLVSGDNVSTGPGSTVTVGPIDLGTPGPPAPAGPLVRFDVCAPFPGLGTCSTTNPTDLPPGKQGTCSGSPSTFCSTDPAAMDCPSPQTCITVSAGTFGVPYNGSIGDSFMSHLLESDSSRQTPAIYFLQDARDTANGIFGSISGQFLQGQLFIDNQLQETKSGGGTGTGSGIRLQKDL